jgi:multidrug efflux system outer membrane protein
MASWEPDVFGSLRRSAEEAQANYAASEEARRNVWLTVLADVAQAYFQLLAFDVQRQITLRTIGAREETLELYRTQLKGGVATGLEVARAEADLYSAQATLSSVELQIATSENAISLLLGLAPGPVARSTPSSETLAPPPEVPAGLPSSLLARRPDVRQAEAQLVSANAEVGVQTAKLFPTFPLTAAPSLMSLAFSGLSIKGFSYLLLGTANWTAPILQGSALLAQVSAANAAKKAALVAYEQAMFTALREVNDALVSLDRLRDERTLGENQVAQLARAVDISLSEFHGGTATYLDVVTAQETEFSAQLSLAQLEGQQLVEFVQLYRALGGGWWLAERRG